MIGFILNNKLLRITTLKFLPSKTKYLCANSKIDLNLLITIGNLVVLFLESIYFLMQRLNPNDCSILLTIELSSQCLVTIKVIKRKMNQTK